MTPHLSHIEAADAPAAIGPYGKFFGNRPPARVTIGVSALPKGARVEIDAIVAASSARPSAPGAELG